MLGQGTGFAQYRSADSHSYLSQLILELSRFRSTTFIPCAAVVFVPSFLNGFAWCFCRARDKTLIVRQKMKRFGKIVLIVWGMMLLANLFGLRLTFSHGLYRSCSRYDAQIASISTAYRLKDRVYIYFATQDDPSKLRLAIVNLAFSGTFITSGDVELRRSAIFSGLPEGAHEMKVTISDSQSPRYQEQFSGFSIPKEPGEVILFDGPVDKHVIVVTPSNHEYGYNSASVGTLGKVHIPPDKRLFYYSVLPFAVIADWLTLPLVALVVKWN